MSLIPMGEPTPDDLPKNLNEIWRNIRELYSRTSARGQGNARVHVGPTPPPNPQVGDLWYDTSGSEDEDG